MPGRPYLFLLALTLSPLVIQGLPLFDPPATRSDQFHLLSIGARRPVPAWDGVLTGQDGQISRMSRFSDKARLCLFFREPVHLLGEHLSNLGMLARNLGTNRFAALAITDQPVSNLVIPFAVQTASNSGRILVFQDPAGELFRLYGIRQTPGWLLIGTNNMVLGEAYGLRDWAQASNLCASLITAPAGTNSLTNRASSNRATSSNVAAELLKQLDNDMLFY
mgnify:FL=1